MKQTLILTMLAVGALALADDVPAPELGKVIAALQPVTATLSPAPEVKTNGTSSLTVFYRTQTSR